MSEHFSNHKLIGGVQWLPGKSISRGAIEYSGIRRQDRGGRAPGSRVSEVVQCGFPVKQAGGSPRAFARRV